MSIKTKKQIEATRMLAGKAKHNMLFGGSRSGKTFAIVRAIIIRCCKTKSRHISLRQTFNAAKISLWLDTIPKVLRLCFPNLHCSFNKTDYYIKFPNGSEYWIGGLDDPKRVEKILGNEYSTIHFNECSQLNYSSIQIALTRLAEKNSLKKKVYYDQNPPRKNHWSYQVFELRLDPIENEPLKNFSNYQKLLMNPYDNLENIDEDYLEMLEGLPEKERDRFLKGLYTDVDDGTAYYSFKREDHVRSVKKKAGTVMIGMDFNVDPMTAIIGQYIDETFYVFDERFLPNSDTFKMSYSLIEGGYSGVVFPDSTGKNRKTSGKSDFAILKENGFYIEKTKNPFVTDRVNNLNRLFQKGRIIIDPKCKKLINDLEKVVWKDNQLDQKTDKMLTHISDALGYWCWKIDPLTESETRSLNINRIGNENIRRRKNS